MRFKRSSIGLLLACSLWSAEFPAAAELAAEQVTVAKMPPPHADRLFLTDVAIPHLHDGKVVIIDGRSLKVEGLVSTSAFAQTTLSPDRSELYAVTTYYTKLNRGERSEWILVYDVGTLALKQEIPYPAHHAEALPYIGTLRTSADGRFIYAQNSTPASSISIVDRQAGRQVEEVQTPGCYMVYPAASSHRVSTLCGDGTMLTLTLDGDGHVASKHKSAKFFDPEANALFVSAVQDGDTYHFVSFLGDIVAVDVGGETARAAAPWHLVPAAEAKQGWRPGGYQPIALHARSGTLYVAMHPHGTEGSHKDPAKEIWVYDLRAHQRVGRTVTPAATGVTVGSGEAPRVFAFDAANGSITAFTGLRKLVRERTEGGFGDTPTQMEAQ